MNIMKKYLIYWHVKDNAVTYPHNDNMQLYARSEEEAERKAWNRIRSEFDYSAADVDHMEVVAAE